MLRRDKWQSSRSAYFWKWSWRCLCTYSDFIRLLTVNLLLTWNFCSGNLWYTTFEGAMLKEKKKTTRRALQGMWTTLLSLSSCELTCWCSSCVLRGQAYCEKRTCFIGLHVIKPLSSQHLQSKMCTNSNVTVYDSNINNVQRCISEITFPVTR